MKRQTRAWLLALTTMGVASAAWAQAEVYRCNLPDGGISFQANPCSLPDLLVTPTPPAPVRKPEAPRAEASAPRLATVPRSVATPEEVTIPAALAHGDNAPGDEGFVRPTKRKRDILELTAQFERCRADVEGFAEKSAPVYAAWTQRHAAVLAEYDKLLAAKVRAGRRGEMTLPVRLCTDDWLKQVEPLTHMPDARFQTVEKTWQVFMGALMTGDRKALLNCLSGNAATRWNARAERMTDDEMRRIGASIRGLKVQWGDDYEKEGVVADTDNHLAGIAFRNINEEWKITDLGGTPSVAVPAN